MGSDIIFSERRGQSQKPEEIYHLIEQLVPNGEGAGPGGGGGGQRLTKGLGLAWPELQQWWLRVRC